MKPQYLFLACAVVLVLAFVVLAIGFNGKANFTFGSPFSATAVQVCGTARGGWALGGIVGVIIGIVLFVVAFIRLIKGALAG